MVVFNVLCLCFLIFEILLIEVYELDVVRTPYTYFSKNAQDLFVQAAGKLVFNKRLLRLAMFVFYAYTFHFKYDSDQTQT